MDYEEVKQNIQDVILSDEVSGKLNKVINNSTNMTWLELLQLLLPLVIEKIEDVTTDGVLELSSTQKSMVASEIILPIIKEKLPWYIKPFAGLIIKYAISLIVSALNKIFSKQWVKKK